MAAATEIIKTDVLLKFALRLIGTSSLSAFIFVAAPYAWMNAIHAWIGLGELPGNPVVGYLARSASAFYAMLGGLLWVVSFDLKRHRTVLIYMGVAIFFFGVAMLIIDWWEGLPLLWKIWEGPFLMSFGLFVYFMSKRLEVGS